MNIDAEIHRFTLCFLDPTREEAYHTDQKQKRDTATFVSIWLWYCVWTGIMIDTWIETLIDPMLRDKSTKYATTVIVTGGCILLEVCALCFRSLTRVRGFCLVFALFGPLCLMTADHATKSSVILPMYISRRHA